MFDQSGATELSINSKSECVVLNNPQAKRLGTPLRSAPHPNCSAATWKAADTLKHLAGDLGGHLHLSGQGVKDEDES